MNFLLVTRSETGIYIVYSIIGIIILILVNCIINLIKYFINK
jgi:hypothetical protein